MHIMINAIGSSGDINPMLMIGARLLADGHKVDFIASPQFEKRVKEFGLRLLPLGTKEQYEDALKDPDVWKLNKAFAAVWRLVITAVRQSYDWIESEHTAGDTILIGSTLGLATRLAQEKLKIPTATVHLSPALMLSSHDTPNSASSPVPDWLPASVRSAWVKIFERLILDPIAYPPLNELRAELNLPPVRQVISKWIHSPELVLCAFPDWFAPVQADWPANSVNCNFPVYKDRSQPDEQAQELIEFLNAGSPPVVITAGTAMAFARSFIEKGINAALANGLRAVVVCAFDEQVPELPANTRCVRYADFNKLFKNAAAVIHHGGIGTSATALAQGCPQLVVPFAHDQFDNAKRLERLGVGKMCNANGSISSWANLLSSLQTIDARQKCELNKTRMAQEKPGEEVVAEFLKNRLMIKTKFS